MPLESHVTDHQRSFLYSLFKRVSLSTSYTTISLGFDGINYDVFDDKMRFRDWLNLHIGDWKKRDELIKLFDSSATIFHLLSSEDIERLECELDLDKYPDAIDLFLIAGEYDKVRLLNRWDQVKDEKISVYFSTEQLPDITLDEEVSLCKLFQDEGIIGNTMAMVSLYYEVAQICTGIKRYPDPDLLPNILVTGEPGTGKELFANIIHKLTGREGRFRAINCSTIPTELLESELFGHKKGAFTGAEHDKEGILQTCNRGTVQLDEINKMPRYHQEKLLRLLQERQFQPVGSTEGPIDLDILFVATSNEDLYEKLKAGDFAKDLYDRLSSETIEIPPLGKRSGDISFLVHYFLKQYKDNPLYPYRFAVAKWIENEVVLSKTEAPEYTLTSGNVRAVKNLVGRLVRRSVSIDLEHPILKALRAAVIAAEKMGSPRPVNSKTVVTYLEWEGETYKSPSMLQQSKWKQHVETLRAEGWISAGHKPE